MGLHRHDATAASAMRDTVSLIYRDSYAEQIAEGDAFSTEKAFMDRFDSYVRRDGFDFVIAYTTGQEPVGQAWGWPLGPPDGGWWRYLTVPPEPGFADEDGTRTFALSELMVRRAFTGRGIAHAMHDFLLAKRPESRAALLVHPDNEIAYRAYIRWGWSKAAEMSWSGAPRMDVLILPLPLKRGGVGL